MDALLLFSEEERGNFQCLIEFTFDTLSSAKEGKRSEEISANAK